MSNEFRFSYNVVVLFEGCNLHGEGSFVEISSITSVTQSRKNTQISGALLPAISRDLFLTSNSWFLLPDLDPIERRMKILVHIADHVHTRLPTLLVVP